MLQCPTTTSFEDKKTIRALKQFKFLVTSSLTDLDLELLELKEEEEEEATESSR